MTKPQLVDDLIPLILEARDDWWARELTRLALISPSWRHHVRRRLYARPSLRTLEACELLARTVCENPTLAELVKGIELRPDNHEGRATTKQLQAVQILLGLEGLEELSMAASLSIRAERFLNAIAFPESILRLHIEGDGNRCGLLSDGSLEIDEGFWYRFCSLQTLKLVNMRVDVVQPPGPIPTPIKQAIISNCEIALAELLASSSLDLLSIHTDCSCQHDLDLREILHNPDYFRPAKLQYTLKKGCQDSDASFLAQPGQGASPQSIDTLRSLHLDGHFIEMDLLNNLTHYSSVEELVISGRSVRISSEEWAHFIASGALPSLRRLQLPGGTSRPPYARWAAKEIDDLQRQCSSRQIQLMD